MNKNLFLLTSVIVILFYACKRDDDPVPAPALSSVSTPYGFIGDPLSISGTNLSGATSVTFNGKASTIIQNSATQLTTVVPPNATPGINDLVVHTAGGSSNALTFEVFALPEVADSLPPSLVKTIPEVNFSEYPILIYGDQLSGAVKVTFNDEPAIVYTNNRNVITTTIPAGLPAGNVQIKVMTLKGTATINFQVQGPPPGGAPSLNFSIVDIPPPSYVPAISNNWSCGLFSARTDSTFVDLNSDPEFDETYTINGKVFYDYENSYNSRNYIEFTNEETGEVFAGQFSASTDNPCILKMVLISSKTGLLTVCTFDRRDNDATLVCDE